jgi:rhodanese-related sulfurtransferase
MRLTFPQQIVAALVVALVAAVWFANANRTPVRELDPLAASRAIADRGALVVDVRPKDAYDREHVANAISVPIGDLERRLGELAPALDRPIVVYCGDGRTGEQATRTMAGRGYTDAANVKGGIAAWKGAGLPVVK